MVRSRSEPFRPFFPLGVLLGWVGIGHWLLYSIGITATYSCMLHGLVQTQAFLMAFAVAFLMTALPRRTQGSPASAVELWIAATALTTTTVAAMAERWAVAEICYVVVLLLLLQFAVRRFLGRTSGRRPPAAFVLIPFAFLHGIAGAGFIVSWVALGAPGWTAGSGGCSSNRACFSVSSLGSAGSFCRSWPGHHRPPTSGRRRMSARRRRRTARPVR